MQIEIESLRKTINLILKRSFSPKEVRIISDYLVWAQMSGKNTQGIIKLTGAEALQDIKPGGKMIIEKNTPISQVIDAKSNPAILTSSIATENAIKKAKKKGIGIVGVRNTFSSNGCQGYYVENIAKEGFIGFMCSRSPSSTTGFDSIDPLFGTNPIGFAFPTKDQPMVFDMATSAITWYGLVLAKARGEKIPQDVAIDANGDSTSDPAEAMKGAILPFDRSYKGSGISMMVELLAGPLIGSSFVDNKTFKEEWGTLIVALDPGLLVDRSGFISHCTELRDKIKSSRKRKGQSIIRLPGESAHSSLAKSKKSGFVEVDDAIWNQIQGILERR